VTVATTGTDPDPDGYLLDVRSTLVGFERVVSVAPNASATFPSLRPASDYRVTLQGGAANCVAASTVRTVAVNAGSATTVTFDIACEPAELLAFVRDGDIYAIASNGSGATRLTTDPDPDGNPAWSSTGLIAFTTQRHNGDPELYVMSADGTNQVRLTTSAGTDGSPSWSVNGGKLVFSSARGLNSEVYTINVDGTGLTRLTTNDAYDDQPAWSSTGKIAFVSDRDHFAGEIYVMNEDGSNVVRLTHNEAAETGPVWSPDGSMIAFARQVDCYYYCQSDLFVMAADGSAERLLATGGSAVYYADPSWSPNGQAIAVTQQYCPWYCESPTIQIVDMQGNQRLLIDGAFDPSWRP
jgi:TolB protein